METIDKELEIKIDKMLAYHRLQSDINDGSATQAMYVKNGPFYIDKNLVPVDIYRSGLEIGVWEPITITAAICENCKWTTPEFDGVGYRLGKGFLCSLNVNGYQFLPSLRGKKINLSANLASAMFLNFLGFEINSASLITVKNWALVNKSNKQETKNLINSLKAFYIERNPNKDQKKTKTGRKTKTRRTELYLEHLVRKSVFETGLLSYKTTLAFREMTDLYNLMVGCKPQLVLRRAIKRKLVEDSS